MQLRTRSTGFVRTEGGLLPPDLLERVRALDRKLPGLDEASYGLAKGERFGEAITRSWLRLQGAWATFTDELPNVPASDSATTTTRQRFLLPLMEELGYGRLTPVPAIELDGKSYPISHAYADTVSLHLVGANVPLDRRSKGIAGAAGQSPHGLLQELLNRSPDRLWGIATNGKTLRILRDNASLTRQAYVEFDLEAIFTGEAYADFALLWHLAHRTRLEPRAADSRDESETSPASQANSYLERWSKEAEQVGARARDKLRDGVAEAIAALGSGFLKHPANGELRRTLEAGELSTQDYYRELLRLVYRLLLLFVAEDRDLLLDPKASPEVRDRYTRYYSTARLRRLAERRKGSRHADLYAGLKVVIAALGRDDGAPAIGLPPLGGFLFGPDACPHLDGAELANADLLDAIRDLATIEEKGVRRVVDYRNLASEELGSIYESLLEQHPVLDTAAGHFKLDTAAGHERKTTGSYYTPSSLISVLLDSALDPVLDEIATKPTREEAERAILEMSVLDPAAGSGHFLVAAAHRIAKRLAQVRTGDEEPAPDAIRTALRDVIGHCLYAVDINPMAVELCKVSLWLEALEPGKPLTFLDHHIKCGNSLLGTTPELVAQGIPDAAYDPIEGDDKAVAAALKKRNRQEREGQLGLGEAPVTIPIEALALAADLLDALPEDTAAAITGKGRQLAVLEASLDHQKSRSILDAWCAAFVAPKRITVPEITTATVRAIGGRQGSLPAETQRVVRQLAAEYALFHWPLEFPVVFRRGGFDVVVGNPPWERVKLQEKEFFAERNPAIANARNAADRKRMIATLQHGNPPLWEAFRAALRRSDGESQLFRNSGRYPLAGRGDINTYAVFAELMRSILGARGRQGVILPTGIATDDTTKFFFGDLVDRRSLVSLFSFENEEFVFPAVHHATKFCLLTVAGSPHGEQADLLFFARRVSDLGDRERHFALTPTDFALLNPNTRTCPTFRSRRDAEMAKAIYTRVPVLVDESKAEAGNPWGVSFLSMLHMANDSGLFLDVPGPDSVPLYEGKMIHQFDHRYGTYEGQTQAQKNAGVLPPTTHAEKADPEFASRPQYWVSRREVDRRASGPWALPWFLGWRDITSAVAVRTMIAAVLPRVATNNKLPLVRGTDPQWPLLVANLNAFAFDWCARQKLGGTGFTFFVLKQVPVLPPDVYRGLTPWSTDHFGDWLRRYAVELCATSADVLPFARDLGWTGGPFRWDRQRRLVLRAEVDAAFLLLYGIERTDAEHVMDSFWVVRDNDTKATGKFITKELVLEAYDAMTAASRDQPFVSRLDPPPGDPRAAHVPRRGEEAPRWLPWEDVIGGTPPPDAAIGSHGGVSLGFLSTPARMAARRSSQLREATNDALPVAARDGGWTNEVRVSPTRIVSGMRVRHDSRGIGTVLTVKATGNSTELLIRFDGGGEAWILFGLGKLAFAG